MKLPGEETIRMIVGGIIVMFTVGLVWYAIHTRDKAKTVSALTDKVEVMQESAQISKDASDQAGIIISTLGRKTGKDREIINAARRNGATAADHYRVQRRAAEAFASGQRADCRLQREDCGASTSAAADD